MRPGLNARRPSRQGLGATSPYTPKHSTSDIDAYLAACTSTAADPIQNLLDRFACWVQTIKASIATAVATTASVTAWSTAQAAAVLPVSIADPGLRTSQLQLIAAASTVIAALKRQTDGMTRAASWLDNEVQQWRATPFTTDPNVLAQINAKITTEMATYGLQAVDIAISMDAISQAAQAAVGVGVVALGAQVASAQAGWQNALAALNASSSDQSLLDDLLTALFGKNWGATIILGVLGVGATILAIGGAVALSRKWKRDAEKAA